jgi:PEP-CTERM motif
MRINMQHFPCIVIVLLAASGIARADTFYSDPTAWAAAVPGATTINFNGVAPSDPSGDVFIPTSLTIDGVTFGRGPNGSDNELFVLGADAFGFGVPAFSAESTLGNSNPENDALITLSASQTAVGFDFIVSPGTVTITLSDGSVFTIANPNGPPAPTFFGVTGSTGITSIDIATPASLASASMNVTDFSFTPNASPVPEPSSLALLATGLVGFGGALRKKLAHRS